MSSLTKQQVGLALIIAGILFSVFVPVYADVAILSSDASEDYYYEFAFKYDGIVLMPQKEEYTVSTGTPPSAPRGSYALTVFNRAGRELARVSFSPDAMMDALRTVYLPVPYQTSGALAVVSDATRPSIARVDLTMSSTCNDNGICESRYGEDSYYCAADCPRAAAVIPADQPVASATPIPAILGDTEPISHERQAPVGLRIGLLFVGLAIGAVAAALGMILHRYRSKESKDMDDHAR